MRVISSRSAAIVSAVERGYRVTSTGDVIGLRGRKLDLCVGSTGYLQTGIATGGRRITLTVHRLVAYCKYGVALFDAECVRHLDGNPLNNSWDNVVLGTHSENMIDIPVSVRLAKGQVAARATRKLTDDQVRSIRYWYGKIHPDTGVKLTGCLLAKMYNTSNAQISFVVNRYTYKHVA